MSPGMEDTLKASRFLDYLVALQKSDPRPLTVLADLAITKEVAKSYGITDRIMKDEVMLYLYILEHER